MGPERRSMIISDYEKEITAYHEAGHALIGLLHPGFDTVHKITIIPRGRALGLTMRLPVEEKHTHSRQYWFDQITVLLAGHVSEMIKFNEITTGSSNDIERATTIARSMVCEWGMSRKFGPMAIGKRNEQVFLGKEISHERNYSEQTAQLVDEEIHGILNECEKKAHELIESNRDRFETIARYLIERETLDAADIEMIMKGEALPALDEKPQGQDTGNNAAE